MEIVVTSIINGAKEILLEDKELLKYNNPKLKHGFSEHDDCIDFLEQLEVNNKNEFIKECKDKDISIAHNLILKHLQKTSINERWFINLKRGIEIFVRKNDEDENFKDFRSKRLFQIMQEHVFSDIDINEQSRNCLREIKNIHITDDSKHMAKLKEKGDRGENNSLRYEKAKKEVTKAIIVSHYDEQKGFDLVSCYKNGLEKKIEVKASSYGNATIKWGQWKKAKKIHNLDNYQYEFHLWRLKTEELAIITRDDILARLPNIEIDIDSKSHWDTFKLDYSDFNDKFFKPFDS